MGGIAGWCICSYGNNILFACRADGDVSLTGTGATTFSVPLCAGGIAGYNGSNDNDRSYRIDIYACQATGDVTVTHTGTKAVNAYAGGLVGYNSVLGDLEYSYARGTATATTGGNIPGSAGAIVGYSSGTSTVRKCFGAGAGGKGTSGLEAKEHNIAYNMAPLKGEIKETVADSWWGYDFSTTIYDASATPAYGISVVERVFDRSVWNNGEDLWPAPNMEWNGENK